MASPQKVRVAIIGLGFGAEFIPIYQNHPHAEMYAICQRTRASSTQSATLRHRRSATPTTTSCSKTRTSTPFTSTRRSPTTRREPRGAEGRQARGLHRADGHEHRRMPPDRRGPAQERQVYMMMETVVYSREYLFVKELYDKGELGGSSSCAAATSRTWTAGPTTGQACRRCTTPPTASARAWRSLSKRAESVVCHGSGRIREELTASTAARSRSRRPRSSSRIRTLAWRGDAQPVRHGAAVPRELRRVRRQEELRMAAGRERASR